MTAPFVAPAAVDVALAVRRRLAAIPGVTAVLGPQGALTPDEVWMFVRELRAIPEGSAQVAAVIAIEGPWARPNMHNTARFPRVALNLYADPSRDSSGAIATRDAEARAWAAWEPFNTELDRKVAFSEIWGKTSTDPGLRVWGSHLLSLPDVYDVSDWDGGRRLQVHYGLSVG